MSNERLLQNLFGGDWQSYNANAARAVGGIAEAIFLQYVLRWQSSSEDGWCYRTEVEIERDTAIKRLAIHRVRRGLTERGILIEHRRGAPARMYYRIDADALVKLLEQRELVIPNQDDKLSGIDTTGCMESIQPNNITNKKPTNDLIRESDDAEQRQLEINRAGQLEIDKEREREATFNAYADGCGFTGPTRGRALGYAAADLTQMQTDGILPDPDEMRMMTSYVIAVREDGGYTRKPSFAQVIDARSEFEGWCTAWIAQGQPRLANGSPHYLLVRERAKRERTSSGKRMLPEETALDRRIRELEEQGL